MYFPTPDSIATLTRLLLLGILLLVERSALRLDTAERRKHVCLQRCFLLLVVAEAVLFGAMALAGGLGVAGESTELGARIEACGRLLYAALWVSGLLFVFLAFSRHAEGDRPATFRRRLRSTGWLSAVVMVVGLALGATFRPASVDTGLGDLGWRGAFWMLAELAVIAGLVLRALNRPTFFTSHGVLKLFLASCACLIGGCVARYAYGPKEPFTSMALALLITTGVRDLLAERERRREQQVSEKDRELRLLHHIATRLKSTFRLEELFNILLENLVADLHAEAGGVFVREGDGLAAKALQGAFPPPMPVPEYAVTRQRFLHEFLMRTPIGLDAGVLGEVVRTRRPVTIDNAQASDAVEQTVPDLIVIHSLMAFPLVIDDDVYGVIQLVNRTDGAAFSARDKDFMQLVVEQAALAIHNARLHQEMIEKQRTEHELSLARDIQLRLIPTALPQTEGLDLGAVYQAARQIGGDYYDFYPIDDKHLGIAIADVAGKGVPGALVMIMTRTILKMLAAGHLSTGHILAEVNEAIAPELRQGMFVTALYAIIDLEQKVIQFSSAGHNPMIIWRAEFGKCQWFRPQGMALGFVTGQRFRDIIEEQNLALHKGDRVFLYTDGVTEAMNAEMEEFGDERLQRLLAQCDGLSSQGLLDKLLEAIGAHAAGQPQYDDITMVAIRVE